MRTTMDDIIRAIVASVDGLTTYEGYLYLYFDECGEVQLFFDPQPYSALFHELKQRIGQVNHQLKNQALKVPVRSSRPRWDLQQKRWVIPSSYTRENPRVLRIRSSVQVQEQLH